MKQVTRSILDQAWRARWTFAIVLLPAVALLALIAVASRAVDVEIEVLTQDPLAVLDAHPLVGFLSNLGIVTWSATVGVCLMATIALRRRGGDDEAVRFFAASGALTVLLVLDDLFQVHEDLLERVLGRGQTLLILAYIVLVGLYVWRFRRTLQATGYVVLVVAGVFFAVSIAADLLPAILSFVTNTARYPEVSHLIEDGSKFLGIALWLAFYTQAAADTLGPQGSLPGDDLAP